ncbi:MAG TPA: glycosyltransferase family 1 protein [Nitrospiraceae bacterium]|nr:glycosyltransferase family 1 protein [Nitrospiraceae bacterium]
MKDGRIGIDGRELRHGVRTGIGRYLIEVLRAASSEGRECVVYGDAETRAETDVPGVTWRVLKRGSTQWWDQVLLPRHLAQDRISVFLSPYYKAPLRAPCPVVITVHDLFFIGYPGRQRPVYDLAMTWLARLYAARAAAIVTDSGYSQRMLIERLRVAPSKVRVIPVALGQEFRPQPCTEDLLRRYGITPPYLLTIGNFLPHKNLVRLVKAYAALDPALRSRYQLVLAGNGVLKRGLEREASQLLQDGRLTGQIMFPGWIDPGDLPSLYSGSTVFVLPSLEEGFGLPALEAMACGVPVAASRRAAIPEVVGEAGLLFDAEDVGAIARSLAMLLTDTELRHDLAQRGLKRAQAFTRDRTAARVVALLDEISKAGAAV